MASGPTKNAPAGRRGVEEAADAAGGQKVTEAVLEQVDVPASHTW